MIRWLKWGTGAAWTSLVCLWLLFVAQRPAPVWISLPAALATGLSTAALILAVMAAGWRLGERRRVATLAAIAVLSLAIHTIGIEHEVADGYYHDEGTYRHHAHQINSGNFLRDTFFYPHLLYYIDAFAVWTASLAPEPALAASAWLFGVSDWGAFTRLLARLITAMLAGLTAVPVFLLAERVAGLWAGAVGGLLIAFSPIYNQGAHVNTADVPSAFFAVLSLDAVGRLLRAESRRDYALAGVFAGLAAGTKYPAGLVALAIIAVYLRWRLPRSRGERRHRWALGWAGIPSLAVFLLSTPGLALDPRNNVFGPNGALFGYRQYSRGGWIGVVVDSNAAFYLELILRSFAWPAILLGAAGLLLLRGENRARVLWLLPFPVLYLALVVSMSMVVERNVYPALPPVAALLGIGLSSLKDRLSARLPRQRARLAIGLAVVSLLIPFVRVAAQDIAFASPSTREEAARWIHENLPRGAVLLKERYTPNLHPQAFQVARTRWIGSYSVAELAAAELDFVVLSSSAFDRFLMPELHFEDYHRMVEANYREIFESLEKVCEVAPSRTRMGPRILVYKVGLGELPVPEDQEIDARQPIVAKQRERPAAAVRVRFAASHRWRTLRANLAAGTHRLELTGEVPGYAVLSVVDLDDREVAFAEMAEPQSFDVAVERTGRYLLRFYFDKATRLETLRIRRRPQADG